MKNLKKVLALVLVTLLAVATLAGCGGASDAKTIAVVAKGESFTFQKME